MAVKKELVVLRDIGTLLKILGLKRTGGGAVGSASTPLKEPGKNEIIYRKEFKMKKKIVKKVLKKGKAKIGKKTKGRTRK